MASSEPRPDERAQPARFAVGIIPLQNFTLTTFSGFIDMLRLAADEGDRSRPNACCWTVLGSDRNPVRSSCGIEVQPQEPFGLPSRFDVIVIAGGLLPPPGDRMLTDRARTFLRAALQAGVELVGICTGSLALVEAGLLRPGARCCVSWYHYPDLQERFPDVTPVADRLWVRDGQVTTCAGGLAAVDLAATLIQERLGKAVAQKSLHILLAEGPRSGAATQPQPPNTLPVRDQRVRRAMLLMEQNLSSPLDAGQLAVEVAVSKRQLERLFRRDLGVGMQQFGRDMRLSYAVWLMTHASSRISDIAAHCGFADAAHFSRTFRAAFGDSPVAAHRRGGTALQAMLERWWPYGHLPHAASARAAPRSLPVPGDRRPYL